MQNIPSKYRSKITFDGKPVCELDYSGLHINMLYLMAGLPMPEDDVYEIEGVNLHRDHMKGIMQRLINADDRKQTVASAVAEHADNPFLPNDELDAAVEAFEAKHECIRQYFNTGIGTKLQRKDSDMTEMVMTTLLDKGIACIPIHDSFIVQADHEADLMAAMRQASKAVVGTELKIDSK